MGDRNTIISNILVHTQDKLTGEVRRNETWSFPFEYGDTYGTAKVVRMQAEGLETGDHDELVVECAGDSPNATWVYLWSSDPEFPFDTSSTQARVFRDLPDDICSLIESQTGLDMTEARP